MHVWYVMEAVMQEAPSEKAIVLGRVRVDKSRASLFHSLFVNTPPPSPPLSLRADRSTCSFSVAKLKRSLDDLGLHGARLLTYTHEQAHSPFLDALTICAVVADVPYT